MRTRCIAAASSLEKLTNCRRCSNLLVMNFRVLIVHDFSAMFEAAEGHDL